MPGHQDRWGAFVDHHPDAAGGSGPLAGLRIAVKDNIAAAGLKWTAGLPLLADRIAAQDASCVAALRAAGAAIVGTTATDAAGFGMMTPGVTNPIAPDRSAGGSSGGSAAAVAAGLADIALGTDTAGSVRVPAACCGLYGLKPTAGAIPLDGITPLSATFDHVGIIAGDLERLAQTTHVLLPSPIAPPRLPRRIGFSPERLAGCHPALRGAIERTLAWLRANGHAIIEIELPDPAPLAELHGTIVCDDARRYWQPHWPRDRHLFADTARRSLAYSHTLAPEIIEEARARLPALRKAIDHAFAGVDAIIGPTIAVATPRLGARRARYRGAEVPVVYALLAETCPFNVSGHPALAAPLTWPHAGIPMSLQIATGRGQEADACALAGLLATMPAPA